METKKKRDKTTRKIRKTATPRKNRENGMQTGDYKEYTRWTEGRTRKGEKKKKNNGKRKSERKIGKKEKSKKKLS